MSNELQYLDPEQNNTNVNDKLDYKFILMRQIDKVRLSRSTEMRGGYWEKRPIAIGGGYTETLAYIPDTTEIYISSVKALRCLLIVYFDEIFIEKYNELLKDIPKKKLEDDDEIRNKYVNVFDLILEELLMLCLRKKLITGNLVFSDDVETNKEIQNGKNKS